MRNQKQARRETLAEICRRNRVPLTVQRRLILEVLAGRRDHPAADQIYRAVGERLPGLSRTTVYRVLDALMRHGLVGRVNQPGAVARFEARTERHHHLVCRSCQKITDIESVRLDRLPVPKRSGFRISDYSVYFTGTCKDCGERSKR